jgi:hypothetical protein
MMGYVRPASLLALFILSQADIKADLLFAPDRGTDPPLSFDL